MSQKTAKENRPLISARQFASGTFSTPKRAWVSDEIEDTLIVDLVDHDLRTTVKAADASFVSPRKLECP
jgi:hypothetical protein